MSTSEALKSIFTAARPLVETWIDTSEQIAALRETATNAGLDWSQVKALLKAQIQDERDEAGDGKRVRRLLDKADAASTYADMLGLGWEASEKKYSATPHDPETGEFHEPAGPPLPGPEQQAGAESPTHASAPADLSTDSFEVWSRYPDGRIIKPDGTVIREAFTSEIPDLPEFLRRKKVAA